MIFEGVFERLPNLKLVLVESGFAWLPPLSWRLDKLALRMRDETPHLSMLPSEYIRRQAWLTPQPMEEPEPRKHIFGKPEESSVGKACVRASGYRCVPTI